MSTFLLIFIGWILGCLFCAYAAVKSEKDAVKNGYMKIDGKFYLITPLDIGGKKDD